LTITDRVRTNLGREPLLDGLPHLNINTQEGGAFIYAGLCRRLNSVRLLKPWRF
jgi:hypothetical protein